MSEPNANRRMPATSRDAAIELMRQQEFRAALGDFDRLLREAPRDWSLWYMAGQCARFLNDIKAALSYLSRAAELTDSEPQVFLALGIAQQLQGDLFDSQESLRKAVELDSEMEAAYNSLAITQK